MEEVAFSPLTTRNVLLELIHKEIAFAHAGKPAGIWLKLNSLVDVKLIDALYAASRAGREGDGGGARHLLPAPRRARPVGQHPGQVDRRAFPGTWHASACSATAIALPSRHARVYISSADWMERNMDWRVETLVPIHNPTVHAQVLDQIMVINLKDSLQSWELRPDGAWKRVAPGKKPVSAHDYFMTNPSLSGRGSALHGPAALSPLGHQPAPPPGPGEPGLTDEKHAPPPACGRGFGGGARAPAGGRALGPLPEPPPTRGGGAAC